MLYELNESLLTRLFSNFSISDTGCWIWQKSVMQHGGYGQIGSTVNNKRQILYTHKVSYEHFVGKIPTGFELHQVCLNRKCLNPDHLELLSIKESRIRGRQFLINQIAQTECIHGHKFSLENIFWYGKNLNKRMCKICAKTRKLKDHHRRQKTDPIYVLTRRLRGRLKDLLRERNIKKSIKALELIGCTVNELKQHLESKFYLNQETGEMMTWENKELWDIDHIIPCIRFDLIKEEEQRKCFHWSNLQPLWRHDNRIKWIHLK